MCIYAGFLWRTILSGDAIYLRLTCSLSCYTLFNLLYSQRARACTEVLLEQWSYHKIFSLKLLRRNTIQKDQSLGAGAVRRKMGLVPSAFHGAEGTVICLVTSEQCGLLCCPVWRGNDCPQHWEGHVSLAEKKNAEERKRMRNKREKRLPELLGCWTARGSVCQLQNLVTHSPVCRWIQLFPPMPLWGIWNSFRFYLWLLYLLASLQSQDYPSGRKGPAWPRPK